MAPQREYQHFLGGIGQEIAQKMFSFSDMLFTKHWKQIPKKPFSKTRKLRPKILLRTLPKMTGRKWSDIAQYPKWPLCGHRDVNSQWAACTTRVRKTEVRTTPVRSQQCECQQCEGVNSANETRVRMSNVRMPAVRCDIGAKKVRQQCECQQCESHFFFSLILIGFERNGKREPAKT